MKPRLLIVALLLGSIVASNVVAQLGIYSAIDGHSVPATVSDEQLMATKPWAPLEGEPLISPRKAMQLAQPVYDKLVLRPGLKSDESTYWMLDDLTLSRADAGSPDEEFLRNRWFWIVSYQMFGNSGNRNGLPNLKILVLMDGTVIPPKI